MKKNGHLIRNIIIRLVIALFPFVPVYGQDELESSVQKFVRERMVFDVQGQHASSKNRTFLAWEADFGINICQRLTPSCDYDSEEASSYPQLESDSSIYTRTRRDLRVVTTYIRQ